MFTPLWNLAINLGLTRDDAKIYWTKVIAVIVGLASLSDVAAAYVGVPLSWLPPIRLAALVVTLFAGTATTSLLPGDPKK